METPFRAVKVTFDHFYHRGPLELLPRDAAPRELENVGDVLSDKKIDKAVVYLAVPDFDDNPVRTKGNSTRT